MFENSGYGDMVAATCCYRERAAWIMSLNFENVAISD